MPVCRPALIFAAGKNGATWLRWFLLCYRLISQVTIYYVSLVTPPNFRKKGIVDTALKCEDQALIDRIIVMGGKPLLGHYVSSKNYLMIRELLDRCPNESKDSKGAQSILHEFLFWGVRAGDPNVVTMCLDKKPKLEKSNDTWRASGIGLLYHTLQYAYYNPYRDQRNWDHCETVMKQLLEYGIDPNHKGPDNISALHYLSDEHYGTTHVNEDMLVVLARLLLEKQAEINAIDGKIKTTPLAWAARFNRKKLVKLFLERGADPNLPSATPESLLAATIHTD